MLDTPKNIVPEISYSIKKGTKITAAGIISENTFWQADTVLVTDSVKVAKGVTLKIKASTRVEFAGYFPLLVQGRLLAEGKPDSMIVFTAQNNQSYSVDASTNGAWHGIRFVKTSAENDSSMLKYCQIEYSKSVQGVDFSDLCGGAVYLENFSKLRIENCRLENNTALYGGAVYSFYNSSPEIVGCLIINNHALNLGAALINYYSAPKIVNNTIVQNEILNTSPDIPNGAVFNFLAKPHFYNNIVRNNQVFTHSQLRHHKYFYTWNNNLAGDSLINNNIDYNPLFNSEINLDFSLTAQSPCIDQGNYYPPYLVLPAKDLAGNNRFSNSKIDIGAYEYAFASINSEKDLNCELLQNYPNPFNPITAINFTLSKKSDVELNIFNIKGELVKTLAKGEFESGNHSFNFDGTVLNSGVYFYQLESENKSVVKKMILLK